MGFFENLGRKVEEFKRTAEDAAAEESTYVCSSCGERFHHDHAECPACGADAIVEREPGTGAGGNPSADTDASRDPNLDDDRSADTDAPAGESDR